MLPTVSRIFLLALIGLHQAYADFSHRSLPVEKLYTWLFSVPAATIFVQKPIKIRDICNNRERYQIHIMKQ